MPNGLKEERLQALSHNFSGGINLYTEPHSLPETDSISIVNYILQGGALYKQRKEQWLVDGGVSTALKGLFYNRFTPSGIYFVSNNGSADKLYKTNPAGVLGTVITASNTNYAFTIFKSSLFLCAGDNLYEYNGSNLINVTTTHSAPKSYSLTVFKNRLFASGIGANAARLYFSALNAPHDWTTPDDAGYIDIDDTRDAITNVISFYDVLVVFKSNSIYLLQGSEPADFVIIPVHKEVGCISNLGAVITEKEIFFLSPQGGIYPLSATQGYGNFIAGDDIAMKLNIQVTPDNASYMFYSQGEVRLYFMLNNSSYRGIYIYDFIAKAWTRFISYDTINLPCVINGLTGSLTNLYFGRQTASESSGNIQIYTLPLRNFLT